MESEAQVTKRSTVKSATGLVPTFMIVDAVSKQPAALVVYKLTVYTVSVINVCVMVRFILVVLPVLPSPKSQCQLIIVSTGVLVSVKVTVKGTQPCFGLALKLAIIGQIPTLSTKNDLHPRAFLT